LGRKDDLIITGGHKVWPSTVERALKLHPNVADVCVKGAPDPTWGNAVIAWIVRKDDKSDLSLSEVKSFLQETLPDYSIPKTIYFQSEIPRNALGKVRYNELIHE
jgi:acyl-CoA synthetase (AMP-forming)/AMP-acid ligase II